MDILKTIIVTGTTAAMLVLTPVSANAATCKPKKVIGYAKAVGPTKANAEAAAKQSWVQRTTDKYGLIWTKPKSINTKCGEYDASLAIWQCTYAAKACKKKLLLKAPVRPELIRQ